MPEVTSHVLVCSRRPRTSLAEVAGGTEVRVAELGRRWLSVPVSPGFPLWLRRLRADVVHVHMPNPVGEASVVLAAGGRPVVASYHADIVRQARLMPAYGPLVGSCLGRSAAIVVASGGLLESSPLLGPHRDRVTLVPYGIDLERYRPEAVSPDERAAVRERFAGRLVLFVGRLVYYKGLEYLLAAARNIDASIVVVGSGPLEGELRTRARSIPNVHFTGTVSEDDLVRYLAAADCFVMPSTSRAEGFGIATLEAQAMGVPAVVTDVGTGTVEAIAPGESGVVIPPRDPAALAEAVRSILEDPARAEAMGLAGRRRVVANHSLADRAAAMRRVYERALSGEDR
jgi:glycosyltransferase involved in cell wall biosynthesis